VKGIYSKKPISVLDFGLESVVVLIAEKKTDGSFRIIGAGESEAEGLSSGQIYHVGDATESVVEAIHKAEVSSDTKVETLYFNFDDPKIESVTARAAKNLDGEGEIRPSDIRDVKKNALQIVARFEKTPVYSKEIAFTIDDHDVVADPVGVFGRKLEAVIHVLQARSDYYEIWQTLLKRAGVEKNTPVLSAVSTVYGLLPSADWHRKRLILDLGRDFLNVFVFFRNAIVDYRIFPAKESQSRFVETLREFKSRHPDSEEALITGDDATEETRAFYWGGDSPCPSRLANPFGMDKLNAPKFSSVAGLLRVADEFERKMPILQRDKRWVLNVKEKALSFINEYF